MNKFDAQHGNQPRSLRSLDAAPQNGAAPVIFTLGVQQMLRTAFLALCFLCGHVAAQDLVGEWRVVEWSAANPHSETAIMLFEPDGSLRVTVTQPGAKPIVEVSRYVVANGELVITNGRGEVSRHTLEHLAERIKVRVPFGFFVIERTPNNSLQPTGPSGTAVELKR